MTINSPYESTEDNNVSLNKFILDLLDALDNDNDDKDTCPSCPSSCPLLTYNEEEDKNFNIIECNMFSYMDDDDNFLSILRNMTKGYKERVERVEYLSKEIKKDLRVAASFGKESLTISLLTEELDVISDLASLFDKMGLRCEILIPQGLKLSWM
ncbi:Hypothetical protein ORPV_4 [Orpheovirus IHUMI-LCC2]|uniref:Uncharacterized protein n=1 Tax=Orpheovirus IHUMI-LCC2 TaxID=2023057 RepID=A0A2I2L302_9VIRU|nr:Hypothetical protein ORPV_4 [Orpheovirus IHUMI-LCC2]SNW61908.1 Hypothetical protein ORPV_4 [Orpheovirus IHUMI-LCC2]